MTIEKPERRARNIALMGLVFQILLQILFLFLWMSSNSESLRALNYLSGIGFWIWLALLIIFHQRALVQDEQFETEQLRNTQAGLGGERIFDTEGERLLLAKRRLLWMYRWLLPIVTFIMVIALFSTWWFRWPWGLTDSFSSPKWPKINPLDNGLLIWFVGGAAFLSFLFSRYVVGMAKHREWQMLRAGASYLMGITLASVATAVVLAIMHFSKETIVVPEHVVAYVLRWLLFVLAMEFLLNTVLDLYRPRTVGDEPRPAFDSRLLGLFSEPGGIAGSIAEAINYQFGFDVSSTWLYQLLGRSVVPLIGFAIFTMFLASSLVFVEADEKGVVEHYGQKVAVLEPGLHVKWPWPIDICYKVATEQIHELKIGVRSSTEENVKKDELILWTNQHSQEPHLEVLLATPEVGRIMAREAAASQPVDLATRPTQAAAPAATRPADETARAVPVSILRVAATIQYKVKDAWQWLTQYKEPEKMLEALANREIMRHCASANVMALLGGGRQETEKAIRESIQLAANDMKLGVEIRFFGLQGVHPPEKTADDFQKVISAENEKTASINSAHSEEYKKLTEAAGEVQKAWQLEAAIREMNRVNAAADAQPAGREAAQQLVDKLFFGREDEHIKPVGGTAAVKVANARAARWKVQNRAGARAIAFEQEMATKNAAPDVYKMRKYLEMLVDSTSRARKYVIAAKGRLGVPSFLLDLKDPMTASLGTNLEEAK